MHASRTTPTFLQRQRGAAFIVMLVILVVGVAAFLVSALSKVSLHTEQERKSSDMLAQVKEVVIGYAVNGTGAGQHPGSAPFPDTLTDTNYDGNANNCPAYQSAPTPSGCLGRLPWLTLGISVSSTSQNDPTGVMPWYAVSANLVDPAVMFNSELLNSAPHTWLTVRDMKGNVLSNRVAFVIIIPGAVLPGQSRPSSPLGGANQYLDSITVPGTCTAPCVPGTYSNADANDDFIMGDEHRWIDNPANPGKQIEDATYNFNDKLLYVTIDDLMPLIEKRIAREVKSCLDDYAAQLTNTNHRYPWAVPVNSWPNRTGTASVLFGRVSDAPANSSGGTPPTGTLLSKINAVQAALTAYINGTGTLNALNNAGDQLKDYANFILGQAPTDPARAAGITADNCTGMSCTGTLQSQIDTALAGGGTPDATMPSSWTPACTTFFTSPTSYWINWRDLVFYQVAAGYQPGGGTFTPLHITGSGNPVVDNNTYRAAVLIAGKMLGGQNPRNQAATPPNTYLEGVNPHNPTAPATTFETYKTTDPSYTTVNDLVMCVDGKNNCQ